MNSKMSIKGILAMTIIASICLMFLNMSMAANTAKVAVESANIRENMTTDSSILVKVAQNEELEVLETLEDWCKVQYKDVTGYIKKDLITINQENEASEEEQNVTETQEETSQPAEDETAQTTEETELGKYYLLENIEIKLIPLINAKELVNIEGGQEVNVTKIMNGWAHIEVQSDKTPAEGWVRLDKLKSEAKKQEEDAQKAAEEAARQAELDKTAPAIKTSYVQSTTVNLRKENNTTSEILSKLNQNTAVEVLSEEAGWSKCRVNGTVGYVSTQYLGSKKVEEEATSRGATAARSNVPVSKNGAGAAALARSLVGSRYVHGAAGPNTFDCSGLTYYIYQKLGVTISRTSYDQAKNGVSVSKSAVQPGDILIFKGGGHVGIYVGGDKFVHAGNSKTGVKEVKFSTYGGFVDARRIL